MPNDPAKFDPEKVERGYQGPSGAFHASDNTDDQDFVRVADYDSLLALYRNTQFGNRSLAERIEELARMFRVPDGGRYLNDWITRAEKLIPKESMNRPWPDFKKSLQSEGKLNTDAS